jgi:acyl carrier protein
MNVQEIQDKLLPIIEKYLPEEVTVADITPEKDLLKDLKINSAYLIDIIIAIEETFNIRIEDDEIAKMNTVQEAMDIISAKVVANG